MRIANGIEMLEISCNLMGRVTKIYPVLIWDDKDMVLVDTGLPGQLERFREAVEKIGLSFERISKVLITHQDIGHVGSLASIVKEMNIQDEHLSGPNQENTYDMDEVVKSIKKFTKYDIQNIVCYHSGLYNDNAKEAICELVGGIRK
ncbi:MBL fold metallo-hydrolase [Candidatus Clostridium radicumherbarum]|uniref:MBL fold metallo-hydrolase n=1 Tax=Candidatus Clostridium radicumherbarum TaxID=3381662 RepID=A0ABW8TMM3_9CLOT